MSRVSIVIPCFNDGRFLDDALASARAQTHEDTEIVVVDDGSTDPATTALFDRLERAEDLVVVRQPNAGLPAARNAGIRASSGEYLLPLDADDRIAPEYAALAAAVLDARPEVGIVGGDLEYFGLRTGRDRPTYDGIASMLFVDALFSSSVTRRSDWERVGGYPAGQDYGEDWIYWLRILSLGREVHLLPEVVWHYRQREGQMTRLARRQDWTQALVFAMRDQPQLYADHFDLVVDYVEPRLQLLDAYRHRYGWVSDLAARVRRRVRR